MLFKFNKAVYLCAALLILCGPVFGQAGPSFQAGDVVLGLGIKSATPGLGTDWGEFNIVNKTTGVAHDAKPGISSLGGELQAMYFLTSWLGMGLSVADEYFDHDISSGVNMDVDTRVYNYLFLSRIFLNTQQTYKWYIPLAIGVADISARVDMNPKERFDYTGFAAQTGLGVTRFFNEAWAWAFEMRYNYNKFHATQTNARGEVYHVYPRLNYISVSLRVDYRF